MLAAIRFVWNATKGSRGAPWRSEYVKWRIETYSGQRAETIDAAAFFRFLWREKQRLIRFLIWTGDFAARVRTSS